MKHLNCHPARRGVALLLVLAVLVVAVSTVVAVASVASSARLQQRLDAATQAVDALLRTADETVLHWLQTRSSGIVLPPEQSHPPKVLVLHDAWRVDDVHHELSITAWDQCGMVPLENAVEGGTLRSWLPTAVLEAVDAAALDHRSAEAEPGLDLLVTPQPNSSAASTYPRSSGDEPRWFGGESGGGSSEVEESEMPASDAPPVAVGACVATHNPSPGRINVNTAPIGLIEAALRQTGRGGIEAIAAAREDGRPAPVGGLARSGEDPNASMPQFIGVSDTWAFRIDASVSNITKSWWAVYRFDPEDNEWKLVQRLVIAE